MASLLPPPFSDILFPTNETTVFTYDENIYSLLTDHFYLNKPTLGRMILKTKKFDVYLPDIEKLSFEDGKNTIKKIRDIICCKMIDDFTQYFDLAVWGGVMVAHHKQRLYLLPTHQYQSLKRDIEELNRQITFQVGKHILKLQEWSNIIPVILNRKYVEF